MGSESVEPEVWTVFYLDDQAVGRRERVEVRPFLYPEDTKRPWGSWTRYGFESSGATALEAVLGCVQVNRWRSIGVLPPGIEPQAALAHPCPGCGWPVAFGHRPGCSAPRIGR